MRFIFWFLQVRKNIDSKFTLGVCITFAILMIVARQIMLKMQSQSYQGSVADLVKRGQLKSDRRGMYVLWVFSYMRFHLACSYKYIIISE